jgi:autotransporter-associated beta strand protein
MLCSRSSGLATIAFILFGFIGITPSFAATKTWTGAGADANWSTAANWSPSGAPGAGDDLIFPLGAARPTNNNDTAAGTTYASISVIATTTPYDLSGNALRLSAGLTSTSTAAYNAIHFPITLAATQNFMITGDRIQLYGAVNLNGFTLTLTTAASPVGIIEIFGGVSGAGGLVIAGSGLVAFSSTASTFTGTTTVTGGTLIVNSTDLGPSTVSVSAGIVQLANDGIIGSATFTGGTLGLYGGGGNQHGTVNGGLSMTFPAGLSLAMYSASNYGQLTVPGPLTLSNPTLTTGWSFTSSAGNTFMIVNPMTSSGNFNGLPEGSHFTANGRRYGITYVGGGSTHQIILADDPLVFTAIPTLNNWALALLGSLLLASGLILRKRSRRILRRN